MKIVRDEKDLLEIKANLTQLEADPKYVTESAYRANSEVWPDNRISFIDNHVAYLKAHPKIDPNHYISNLRLKLRKSV